MNTLFVFVSPKNYSNSISNEIEKNFFAINEKCQEWCVDFLFFPILISKLGFERIYDVWPMMLGLSLEDIYERTIQAYRQEFTITSPGIIILKDKCSPKFISLDENNLFHTICQLSEDYGVYKVSVGYGANGIYYGGPKPKRPDWLIEYRRDQYTQEQIGQIEQLYHSLPEIFKPDIVDRIFNLQKDLSDIEYDYNKRTFRFSSYNIDVHLEPASAALYLLILNNPEGISTSHFDKYRESIAFAYYKFGGTNESFLDTIISLEETTLITKKAKTNKVIEDSLKQTVSSTTIPSYRIELKKDADGNKYYISAASKIRITNVTNSPGTHMK